MPPHGSALGSIINWVVTDQKEEVERDEESAGTSRLTGGPSNVVVPQSIAERLRQRCAGTAALAAAGGGGPVQQLVAGAQDSGVTPLGRLMMMVVMMVA